MPILNASRPNRSQLARTRFDAPPHLRWAWDGLVALYIPYQGDGTRIVNRAPHSAAPALTWEGTPVYNAFGAEFSAVSSRVTAPAPSWLRDALIKERCSLLWAGLDPRTNATGDNYTGYFGVNEGTGSVFPWHTFGVERAGTSRTANVVIAPNGDLLNVDYNGPSATTGRLAIVATHTPARSLRAVADFVTVRSLTPIGGYGYGSSTSEIYMGNRYAATGLTAAITTSIGALWCGSSFTDTQLLAMQRDTFLPFTAWKRNWPGLSTTISTAMYAIGGTRARALSNGASVTVRLG